MDVGKLLFPWFFTLAPLAFAMLELLGGRQKPSEATYISVNTNFISGLIKKQIVELCLWTIGICNHCCNMLNLIHDHGNLIL